MKNKGSYYLGIVGAANKSSMALANEDGAIIKVISGPPLSMAVNWNIREDLLLSISEIINGIEPSMHSLADKLLGICIAMSGVYTHQDRLDLVSLMDQIGLAGDFPRIPCEDANAHLAANFLDAGGIVIAGTGSNVFIKARGLDEVLRIDGWGSDIGDDGSGYDLGRKCFRAIFKSEDGRYPGSSQLKERILTHTGVSNLDALIEWFYQSRRTARWRSDLADLAKPLIVAAESANPDTLAYRLVASGANELFCTFATANRRIVNDVGDIAKNRRSCLHNMQPIPLILEGGIFENSYIYRRRFLDGIYTLDPYNINWKVVPPLYKPVVGALAMAMCGQSFLPQEKLDLFEQLQKSAESNSLVIHNHPIRGDVR
jgi:N-acetylglucosamine kinase-like BadF-type ATPase